MDKKTGKEILPFVTTWVCFDGIMLIDLCIIDTDNRLVVVRVAERGLVWWGVGEIGEDGESQSEVAQSCPTLATPWTAAHQAPLSMGFSRQECWSRVPLPSPMHESEK